MSEEYLDVYHMKRYRMKIYHMKMRLGGAAGSEMDPILPPPGSKRIHEEMGRP